MSCISMAAAASACWLSILSAPTGTAPSMAEGGPAKAAGTAATAHPQMPPVAAVPAVAAAPAGSTLLNLLLLLARTAMWEVR